MATILVLNGPNLNLLGRREPAVYGHATLADVERACAEAAAAHGHAIDFRQSNHEGVLIDALHEAGAAAAGSIAGVALNAGGYTHTSIALHDAIKAIGLAVVEVHLSNVHAREAFRHHSCIAPACLGVVAGFGVTSYVLAIEALARHAAAPA